MEEVSTDASDNDILETTSLPSITNPNASAGTGADTGANTADTKKEIKLNTVNKKSTKQSNLMSFFKK